MQIMCSDANCDHKSGVPVGQPVNFVCPACGNPLVMFDQPVSVIDPATKQAIGRLKAGKPVNAEDLRDIRESPWKRAFILEPVKAMEPPKVKVEPKIANDAMDEDDEAPERAKRTRRAKG